MKTQLLLIACFPFFMEAQTTAIPDPIFEEALIDLALDDVIDGEVLTANIDTVKSLNFAFKGISDMTGLQDFIALEDIVLFENYLNELDLSGNPVLTFVNCDRNTISEINVTGNPFLERLRAAENNLLEIDLSGNPALFELSLNSNFISDLDLATNTGLQYLYCNDNNLASLNISACENLLEMSCLGNELTALDFTNNLELRSVVCFENNLVTLDLSAQVHLESLLCANNNLEFINVKNGNNALMLAGHLSAFANPDLNCVQVDEVAYANDNWGIGIDDHTEFSEFCGVGIEQVNEFDISVYPNPTTGTIFIESALIQDFKVYNAQGQIMQFGQLIKGNNALDLTTLSNGIYYLDLGVEEKRSIRKIILQN